MKLCGLLRMRNVSRMLWLSGLLLCLVGSASALGVRWLAQRGTVPLALAPAEIDFGRVAVGAAGDEILVATNPGARRLGVEIAARNAPFEAGRTRFSLDPGESRVLSISFRPTERGPAEATLLLMSEGREIPVSVRGIGYRPAEILVSPLSLSFGKVAVADTSQGLVTIRNGGDEDLELFTVRSERPFAVGVADAAVPAGGSIDLPISFAPRRPGRVEGRLWIESSDPARARVSLHLRGSGARVAPRPAIETDVGALDFGSVPACQASERSVEIANRGADPLTVASVTALPPFSAPARGFRLEPGRSLRLPVTFLPTEAGAVLAPLLIHSNDANSRVLALSLVGEGRSAEGCDAGTAAAAARAAAGRLAVVWTPGDGGGTPGARAAEGESAPRAEADPPSDAGQLLPPPPDDSAAPGSPPVREGSFVDLASYRTEVTAENVATVHLDAASGRFAIDGVQLPVVQLPFDQFFDFEPTRGTGQMNEVGDLDLVLPIVMRDEEGNPTRLEVALTTGTAASLRPDGTLVTLAGEPPGGQGEATLVGLATLPSGGLEGSAMTIVLNVHVAR